MLQEYFFETRESLFSSLLQYSTETLAVALKAKLRASFLVSGGSTPQLLYQQLAKVNLDWQRLDVALVDERWVDVGQAGSNQDFIASNLLIADAKNANFIAMKTAATTAADAVAECENNYQQFTRPFDLTLLGMGADGHTASLFPNAEGLQEAFNIDAKRLCVAINARQSAVTGELTERMSLSLYGLLQSRQIVLLITGDDKLAVYQQALVSEDYLATPISAVLQQTQVPVHVYWSP